MNDRARALADELQGYVITRQPGVERVVDHRWMWLCEKLAALEEQVEKLELARAAATGLPACSSPRCIERARWFLVGANNSSVPVCDAHGGSQLPHVPPAPDLASAWRATKRDSRLRMIRWLEAEFNTTVGHNASAENRAVNTALLEILRGLEP